MEVEVEAEAEVDSERKGERREHEWNSRRSVAVRVTTYFTLRASRPRPNKYIMRH